MIPIECKLPDLSHLIKDRLQSRTMLHGLIGDPGLNRREQLYRRNFARLTDKAIYEYQSARAAVEAQIAEAQRSADEMTREGRHFPILAYIDHMENCINSVARLLRLLGRLLREPISPGLPRSLRKAIEKDTAGLVDMRNALEHIDELIQRDEIEKGQPAMLSIAPDGQGAVLGGHTLGFSELAASLTNLHALGLLMFEATGSKNSAS